MDKRLEQRFRLKVRRLVELILDEENPMPPPADDFKPNVKQNKTVTIGDIKVDIGNLVFLSDAGKQNKLLLKRGDAVKLAQYLFRVLGKV